MHFFFSPFHIRSLYWNVVSFFFSFARFLFGCCWMYVGPSVSSLFVFRKFPDRYISPLLSATYFSSEIYIWFDFRLFFFFLGRRNEVSRARLCSSHSCNMRPATSDSFVTVTKQNQQLGRRLILPSSTSLYLCALHMEDCSVMSRGLYYMYILHHVANLIGRHRNATDADRVT